ncbi:MAG: prepilin-type N-terminal cleavage/methylation domain-containing protein [Candidatus Omnitrophota bacterium]|jgi:prepilin-type N-terminal cleavage/methylation domain-containing protein
MKQLSKDKAGFSLLEVIMAVFLLSIIFLAVSSLYVSSQRFYLASSQKIIIGYEVQYAIQHIYKNTMQAMGDEVAPPDTSAIDVVSTERFDIRIANNDPVSMNNYDDVKLYSYYRSGNELIFDNGSSQESLIPKVIVSAVNFAKNGNILTGSITAAYGSQSATFYFSCYPRLASFN